jgi:biopolymer transport protein ExbD
MAMTSFSSDDDDGLMNEINMTPLVDVMLVLLIIFLVTLPVIHHAARIDLPRASSQKQDDRRAHIDVAVDASGAVRWDGAVVDAAGLHQRIEAAARLEPQPELRLYADRAVRYEHVADLMSQAQAAGLSRMGFVTEPHAR